MHELHDRVLMLLAASLEQWDAIEEHAASAFAVAERLGSPVWTARIRADLADVLAQHRPGDPRIAELRAAALVDAERIGMPGVVERCRGAKRPPPVFANVAITIARTASDAENELSAEFDVVISEVELRPIDGFALLSKVRAANNEVPWVFLSHKDESDTVQRGFELGADDFITKPASPDVVALKVNRVLDGAGRKRKTGGVSGSLSEMALPDVVQILFHGRKSGKLAITADGKRGEILFSEGQIFDASYAELRKEDAVYEMLSLANGDFELDPNFRPTERKIELSPESLLLEGMRRLDESGR